jgi:hypothetical protein
MSQSQAQAQAASMGGGFGGGSLSQSQAQAQAQSASKCHTPSMQQYATRAPHILQDLQPVELARQHRAAGQASCGLAASPVVPCSWDPSSQFLLLFTVLDRFCSSAC